MATAVTCDICDINIIISACPKAKLKLSLQVHLGYQMSSEQFAEIVTAAIVKSSVPQG